MTTIVIFVIAILFGTACNICFGFSGRLTRGNRTAPLMFGSVYMLMNATAYLVIMRVSGSRGIAPQTFFTGAAAGISSIISVDLFVKAMQYERVTLTSLISSCGVLVPVALGVLFLSERLSLVSIIGLILMLGAMFVIQYNKDAMAGEKSLKWLFLAVGAMATNGVVLFMMKLHQFLLPKQQVYEYLFVTFGAGGITGILLWLIKGGFSHYKGTDWKRLLPLAVVLGAVLALNNQCTMAISPLIPSYVLFPVMLGSMLILTAVISAVLFKERLGVKHVIGLLLGMVGITLLS